MLISIHGTITIIIFSLIFSYLPINILLKINLRSVTNTESLLIANSFSSILSLGRHVNIYKSQFCICGAFHMEYPGHLIKDQHFLFSLFCLHFL